MAKLTLSRLLAGFRSVQKYNDNNDQIEAAIENTLSRDGTEPNQMGAHLDMNSNKIINLAAPENANDAARLIDVIDYSSGGSGGGGTDTPAQLLAKIKTVDGAGSGLDTDLVDGYHATSFVRSVNGVTPTAGDVTVPTTGIPISEKGAPLGVATLGADGILTLAQRPGGGGGGATNIKDLVLDFGGVNDDTTDNLSVFAAAEASAAERIYVPEGTFYTTGSLTSMTKYYWGPGKIRISAGDFLPGNYTAITADPAVWPVVGVTGFFRGDTSQVEPTYVRVGQGLRIGAGNRYFDAGVIPKVAWYTTGAGWSGRSAKLTADVAIAATSMTISDSTGFSIGQSVTFYTALGALDQTVVITNIVGNVLTFTPGATIAHATGQYITHGARTWHGYEYIHTRNTGGGDAYGHIVRLTQSYAPIPGQTHFFDTATVGQYGGDVVFTTSGTYATGWESQYLDQGNDVAVIGQVDSFVRTNDTGARSCVWLGTYFKSEGTVPADAAHVVSGSWRTGLDLGRADFSSNGQAAIQLSAQQRIYLNSSVSISGRGGDPSGVYTPFFSNVLGDTWISQDTDGTGPFADIQVGTYRLRLRATGQATWTGTNMNLTGGMNVNGGNLSVNGNMGISDTHKVYLNTAQTAWLEYNGSNIRVTKNGGSSYTNLV